MGTAESINRALNTFFNGFGIPGYLEDNIPPAASLPYLTYKPAVPGGVCNFYPVEYFVTLFQTTQDGNGILNGRLIHLYRLETTLQSSIFFDIFTVLI